MEVRVIPVKKSHLDKIPDMERAFYLHVGHLRNEITILYKLLTWTNNNQDAHQIMKTVNTYQSLMMVRMLAGKLWEGWELVNKAYFATKVSQVIDSKLSPASKEALKELKSYFGKKNIISMVRNQFAFHYSPQHIRDQLEEVEDTDQLEIYMTALSNNIFYQFSETIANSAMLRAVDESDYMAALEKLVLEVMKVASTFMTFCDGCLEHMMKKYLAKKRKWVHWNTVELTNLPRHNEPQLPFFARSARQ